MENHKMKAEKLKCPSCRGRGVKKGNHGKDLIGDFVTCVKCGGSGEVEDEKKEEKK